MRELATRLAGSQDLFDRHDRGTIASVNFVTAHDGFTLADLTVYDTKHNGANGHSGTDGSNDNRSWNHGVEGRTDDPDIAAARRRSMRNLLGTLLLSTGVPMLNAGDEIGRSQRGNNNPYSQDNEISWMSWDLEPWQEDLLETTRHLVRLRRDHPVLRQRAFFSGRQGPARRLDRPRVVQGRRRADGRALGRTRGRRAAGSLQRGRDLRAVGAHRRQRVGGRRRRHAARGAGRDGIRAPLGQC